MKSPQDRLIAVAMLAPSLILLAIFVYGFIGQTLYVSMSDWGRGAALAVNPELMFVAGQNFRDLFTGFLDVRFRQDLVNMVGFSVFFVSSCLVIGLLLASLVDQNVRAEALFRTVFLLPLSLSFIVTGTIWRWLLQPRGGVNVLPVLVGLPNVDFAWLTSRDKIGLFNWQKAPLVLAIVVTALLVLLSWHWWRRGDRIAAALSAVITVGSLLWIVSGAAARAEMLPFPEYHGFNVALIGIVLAATWQMSGYTMALFLAGLRAIPDEVREAAKVDGCTAWQLYRFVELPLLKPIIVTAVIILGHIALKSFDLVFVMAGPDNVSSSVPAISMYLTAFRGNQFAKGGAIAVVLLVLVSVMIVPYLFSTLRGRDAQ